MTGSPENLTGTGLEVIDAQSDPAFAQRHLHDRDVAAQMAGMQRLAQAFVESPDTLLQELVNAAVDLCGADSAGISLKNETAGDTTYQWVATAGKYARFLDATLPAFPSACAVCIDRARPQIFRVSQTFFDIMKVDADTVTDGLLIPWQVNETHGTIWIMAHGRLEAFDPSDCRMMETLANFAAMAVRQRRQQRLLMQQATATAAAAMANELAHQINNPLQSLTNSVYIAAGRVDSVETKALVHEMANDLDRLSALTRKLLSIPIETARRTSNDN
jgi:two-component sensor histidine kinase